MDEKTDVRGGNSHRPTDGKAELREDKQPSVFETKVVLPTSHRKVHPRRKFAGQALLGVRRKATLEGLEKLSHAAWVGCPFDPDPRGSALGQTRSVFS
jgi:hypothetical protein